MKIPTKSTTYPPTQHCQAKPASLPNNFWLPCFYSWPDLEKNKKQETKTIILMPHFLFHRIQPKLNWHDFQNVSNLSPFKDEGHHRSLDPHLLFQTLSLDPLISHVTFSHSQLSLVLHSGTRSFWNSSNYVASPHKNIQCLNIVESGTYSSD